MVAIACVFLGSPWSCCRTRAMQWMEAVLVMIQYEQLNSGPAEAYGEICQTIEEGVAIVQARSDKALNKDSSGRSGGG